MEASAEASAETAATPAASASAAATATAAADKKLGTVTVNVDGLRIRSSASTSGTEVGKVSSGTSYPYYEETSADGYTWLRIGTDQWIASKEGWTTISQ